MSALPSLREPVRTIALPSNVPVSAILGQKGKVVKRVRQLTGAFLKYKPEDHRMDIYGSPRDVGAAVQLLERVVEHYQCSGLQIARKQTFNVLSPELSSAEALHLQTCSRTVRTYLGPADGFILCPTEGASAAAKRTQRKQELKQSDSDTASAAGSMQVPRPSPGMATSQPPLFHLAGDLESRLQQLVDVAAEISLKHPAECDVAALRVYLGKLVLLDVMTSERVVSPAAVSGWTFHKDARTLFETALPQETIRSLDKYLTSKGLIPTHQSKTASLHLESSINWIQYHPSFEIEPSGELRLVRLETSFSKPISVALVGPPNRVDVRLRYVASAQHVTTDPVASELWRRQGEFGLVNGVQVVVPSDLSALDLTLTSARVKLNRVYTSPAPMLPPPSPTITAASPSSTSTSSRRPRSSKRATASAASASSSIGTPAKEALPPVSLEVSVSAVVDNLGGKRLEVRLGCPELNATLLDMHRTRTDTLGSRLLLAAQLKSLLAHVEELRSNVEFQP